MPLLPAVKTDTAPAFALVDLPALPPGDVARLPRHQQVAWLRTVEEIEFRNSRRRLFAYFPDVGPLRRELYPQHLEFFRLGRKVKTRCFMAANRVGKTEGGGGFELTCHLTGLYPDWWEGHRFDRPIDAWAAGDTRETVRDIIQAKLCGTEARPGTGLIPGDLLMDRVKRPNGNGALDYVTVKHYTNGKYDGLSRLGFKSYDQRRESFQGTEKDVIWLDEESDESIRAECLLRLMTTHGLLIETYTPLRGLTPTVLKYLGDENGEADGIPTSRIKIDTFTDRGLVMAGWNDVPHLGEAEKARMLAESEPFLRDARSKGIPSLGAGAIYPVPEEEITVDDFQIPAHWPRVYGMDVGWKVTAAVWGAWDRDTDVVYLYSLHYQGESEPSTHAAGINARGRGIPGVIDPASRGRAQKDGETLLENYRDLGLDLIEADNSRESGLTFVHMRLATGRLKVFRSMKQWFREYRIYRRDEKGKIVKENDHAMDATRYLVISGLDVARIPTLASGVAKYRQLRGLDKRT